MRLFHERWLSSCRAKTRGQKETDPIHSAMYGVKLAEKLEEHGVEGVLSYPEHEDEKYGSPTKFLMEKLKGGIVQ